MIRTRFAPSPTGYLHIGGARTALFSWAYARRHGGKFILRIEDTDQARSTEASVQTIFDGLKWLGLDWDEGPFFQTQRLARYREIANQLLNAGKAYYCYCSPEELDAMREAQKARGEKPRYDGRWRDATATPPAGVTPVIRFKNPQSGDVGWDDMVKGRIVISNSELDDLVLIRADGIPTYNFGVVVDDMDMHITHVIRGDDHVNNTPRQINIYKALGATLPRFAHVPMIHNNEGKKLSKRDGAVSTTEYRDEGFLPETVVNYLARLGWSHGDDEKFSREQLIAWFDLEHVSQSPARFDPEKFRWLNQQYLKETDDARLAELAKPFLARDGCEVTEKPALAEVVALLKERVSTVEELADAAVYFYRALEPSEELKAQHYSKEIMPALLDFQQKLETVEWNRAAIGAAIKETITAHNLKMPKLAMPLRVMITGESHTPAVDAVIELIGREQVLARISAQLQHFPT